MGCKGNGLFSFFSFTYYFNLAWEPFPISYMCQAFINLIPQLRMTMYDKKNSNAQVGIMITMSKFVITRYASSFIFISFALFFWDPKIQGLSLSRFSHQLTKQHGISNHALIHIVEMILNSQVFVGSKYLNIWKMIFICSKFLGCYTNPSRRP